MAENKIRGGRALGIAMGITALVLLMAGGAGAAPSEEWNKTFGDASNAYSGQQTSDGGYIFVGDIASESTVVGWLVKADINGNQQWDKTFNTVGSLVSVQQTSDGGYILVGSVYSYVAGQSALLIKTDANGSEQWNKTVGRESHASSVQQTLDGGYIT